jgi:hypothetical protein
MLGSAVTHLNRHATPRAGPAHLLLDVRHVREMDGDVLTGEFPYAERGFA